MVSPYEQWALSRLAVRWLWCFATDHDVVTYMDGRDIVRHCRRCGAEG